MNERSPTAVIGCAIIGTGSAALAHARALAQVPGARLSAVCGAVAARADVLAQTCGCRSEPDIQALLARADVDAVIIANDPERHDVAIEVARAGRHVLVEKPLAATLAQGEAIAAACREAGIVASVVSQLRFGQDVAQLRQRLAEQAVGAVHLVDCGKFVRRDPHYFQHGSGWRRQRCGGVVMNQLTHVLDLLMHLFGPVATVFARLGFPDRETAADHEAMIWLEFVGGVRAMVAGASHFSRAPGEGWTIIGDKGSIRMHNGEVCVLDDPWGCGPPPGRAASLRQALLPVPSVPRFARGTLTDQLTRFVAAIRQSGPPEVPLSDGLEVLRVAWAVHDAHHRGVPVTLVKGRESSVP